MTHLHPARPVPRVPPTVAAEVQPARHLADIAPIADVADPPRPGDVAPR